VERSALDCNQILFKEIIITRTYLNNQNLELSMGIKNIN